ncbi:hypothetical protein [Phormidium sp. CCY1219]|uniref:hypothetical protein n=1 Tax=Phormidium sp. CCY1219 TaxID=2886104 RepID=UPI002D1F3E40|nr:hypothetical protein [Phormidium sp. CCY1219]MEB3830137.1 hypothetical protein [Phormidium sp. CCY1219]
MSNPGSPGNNPLGSEEKLAILVAFSTIGAIFGWSVMGMEGKLNFSEPFSTSVFNMPEATNPLGGEKPPLPRASESPALFPGVSDSPAMLPDLLSGATSAGVEEPSSGSTESEPAESAREENGEGLMEMLVPGFSRKNPLEAEEDGMPTDQSSPGEEATPAPEAEPGSSTPDPEAAEPEAPTASPSVEESEAPATEATPAP